LRRLRNTPTPARPLLFVSHRAVSRLLRVWIQ